MPRFDMKFQIILCVKCFPTFATSMLPLQFAMFLVAKLLELNHEIMKVIELALLAISDHGDSICFEDWDYFGIYAVQNML